MSTGTSFSRTLTSLSMPPAEPAVKTLVEVADTAASDMIVSFEAINGAGTFPVFVATAGGSIFFTLETSVINTGVDAGSETGSATGATAGTGTDSSVGVDVAPVSSIALATTSDRMLSSPLLDFDLSNDQSTFLL